MTLPPVTQPPVGLAGWIRAVTSQVQTLTKSVNNLLGVGGFASLLGRLRNTVNFYDSSGLLSGKLSFTGNNNNAYSPRRFAIYGGNNVAPQIEYIGAYTDSTGTFINDTIYITTDLALPTMTGSGASGNVFYDINTKTLTYVPSSERYKQNIRRNVDWDQVIDSMNNLTPVAFRYKEKPGQNLYGLIAEEVHEQGDHMAPFVTYGPEGQPDGLGNFNAVWVAWNQQQDKRIKVLEAQFDRAKTEVQDLKAVVADLQARIVALETP